MAESAFDPQSFVTLDAVQVAAVVPVSADLERNSFSFRIEDVWDRGRRPWAYPDRNPFPVFTFWPAIDRTTERAQQLQRKALFVRERITDALDVLRHGYPETDEW